MLIFIRIPYYDNYLFLLLKGARVDILNKGSNLVIYHVYLLKEWILNLKYYNYYRKLIDKKAPFDLAIDPKCKSILQYNRNIIYFIINHYFLNIIINALFKILIKKWIKKNWFRETVNIWTRIPTNRIKLN